MTTKTIYIADDGTEFENKKDCECYEKRYKALLDNPEVIFFDQDLEPLTKHITDEDSWYDLFEKSYYINIPSVECFNQLAEAYEEFADMRFASYALTDSSKIGLWRYNESKYFWENLIEVKAETDKIIEQANKMVLKERDNHEQKAKI